MSVVYHGCCPFYALVGLLLNSELAVSASLVRELVGVQFPISASLKLGLQAGYRTHRNCVGSRDLGPVFTLMWQALSPLSHLPSPVIGFGHCLPLLSCLD